MSEFIVDPLYEYTHKVHTTQRPKSAKAVHRNTYNPTGTCFIVNINTARVNLVPLTYSCSLFHMNIVITL